jgi:hypothetical protein
MAQFHCLLFAGSGDLISENPVSFHSLWAIREVTEPAACMSMQAAARHAGNVHPGIYFNHAARTDT